MEPPGACVEFVEANRDHLSAASLRELVALSLYEPNDLKIDSFLGRSDFQRASIFLALGSAGIHIARLSIAS